METARLRKFLDNYIQRHKRNFGIFLVKEKNSYKCCDIAEDKYCITIIHVPKHHCKEITDDFDPSPTADNEVPSCGHFCCYVRTDHELCFYDSSGAKPEAYGLPTAHKYNTIETQTENSLSCGMQVALYCMLRFHGVSHDTYQRIMHSDNSNVAYTVQERDTAVMEVSTIYPTLSKDVELIDYHPTPRSKELFLTIMRKLTKGQTETFVPAITATAHRDK